LTTERLTLNQFGSIETVQVLKHDIITCISAQSKAMAIVLI